jgi:parallel beta-helix repeat protein
MSGIKHSKAQRRLGTILVATVLIVYFVSATGSLHSAYSDVSPRTIYVNAGSVNDPNEDGSQTHPFNQIQEGLNVSGSGDVVDVAGGVYYEEVIITKGRSGVSLVGEQGAIVDGEGKRNGIRIGVYMAPDYLYNVTVTGFTVRNCIKGIDMVRCRGIRLRNNTLVGNTYNFADYSLGLDNDVDTSNTVDGKPIYYWVNEHDRQVPPDAGFVALINSRDIVVRDLNLTRNGQGMLLKNTTLSTIENVSISDNQDGVYLDVGNVNITITGNSILNNTYTGIYMSASNQNTISDNVIIGNYYGLYLTTASGACTGNLVINNTIQDHWQGIALQGYPNLPVVRNIFKNNDVSNNSIAISTYLSALNEIYHNNFVNNAEQVETQESQNTFDYLGEGNYWSDYNGTDVNNNGIGDAPYVVGEQNVDNFPLMGLFDSFNLPWEESTFVLETISSSTATNVSFNQTEKSITFDLTAYDNKTGFCSVKIPETFLAGPYEIWVGGNQALVLNQESNGTHSSLFFEYPGDGGRVEILGSTVPEFLPIPLIFIFIIVTALVVFLIKTTASATEHRRRKGCGRLT